MSILVTGSVAYDLLLNYDGSFVDGVDLNNLENFSMAFVTPRFAKHHGGTGANISWNLALLHQDPLLVATVGHDGGAYTALLKERGIPVDHIQVLKDHASSTAIIATDTAEHQITFYHPGADSHGKWPELSDFKEDISYAIISPRDGSMMRAGVEWCKKFKVPYLFDPGQQVLAFGKDELLSMISGSAGLIANAYEWGLISDALEMSTDDLLEHAGFLVVTNGEAGLTIFTKEKPILVFACRAETIVNPTGAGDALRAGFLTGLSAKWSLEQCGRLGAALASFVVEKEGTLLDSIDLNDVLGRAEMTYGEMLPELP